MMIANVQYMSSVSGRSTALQPELLIALTFDSRRVEREQEEKVDAAEHDAADGHAVRKHVQFDRLDSNHLRSVSACEFAPGHQREQKSETTERPTQQQCEYAQT